VTLSRLAGAGLLLLAAGAALFAPVLAPHAPGTVFDSMIDAPPTPVHVFDAAGRLSRPFIYPQVLANRLEQRFEEDRARPVRLEFLRGGHLVRSSHEPAAPLLVLGGDGYGRDVFSRLLFGARTSLALALVAALGAALFGAALGGVAGYAGGMADDALMRTSDFVLVLPSTYVVLALRAVLPLVLPPAAIFLLMAGIFAVVGAPFIARGVRAIVRAEAEREYAVAARSLGAGHARLLARHLLPAAAGFLVVQLTVLVPAFILAEATLSYVGLGFPDPMASWGAMLHDASSINAMASFPWLLSPAAAIFVVVLGVNLVLQGPTGVPDSTRPEPRR
jgi:peptide/nickel transport system permease protein